MQKEAKRRQQNRHFSRLRRRRHIFAIRIRQCSRRHYVKVSSSISGYKRSVPGLLDTKHGHSKGGKARESEFRSEKCARAEKGKKVKQQTRVECYSMLSRLNFKVPGRQKRQSKTKLKTRRRNCWRPATFESKERCCHCHQQLKLWKCGQNVEQVRYNIGNSSADQVLR